MSIDEIINIVILQINNIWGKEKQTDIIRLFGKQAYDKCVKCLLCYSNNEVNRINPLYQDHYVIFLYYLSNVLYVNGYYTLSDKVYSLNKMLHGIDLWGGVEMPSIFRLGHPVGSVLGRGCYEDFFYAMHNCTVGENNGRYPKLGRYVAMMSGATCVGACEIGDNVVLSANSYIKDIVVPSGVIVYGQYPNLSFVSDSNKINSIMMGLFK